MNSSNDVNEVWYGSPNDEWDYKKIKYVFDERKETNNPIKTEELISLTMEDGVVPHSMKTSSGGNKPKEDLSKYKVVHPGDIVINPMNVIVGSVGLSEYYGILSPVYITLTLKKGSGKVDFYDYLFSTELFQKSLMGMGNGILIKESELSGKLNTIRMRIPMNKLGNHFLPIPPIKEQLQIVSYLDKKTQKIDELVKKIEQKIELLKEQKTSLINEVVTKGLNPDVEMKDSEVKWIGETPSHWNKVRLCSIGTFSKGKGITKDDIKEEGVPCIRNGEIYTTYELTVVDVHSFISNDDTKNLVSVERGNLLFTGDGETIEEIGKCVVYLGETPLYVGGGINIFKINKPEVDPKFLSYVMSSNYVVFQKSREGRGEIVVHIYSKQLRNILLVLPDLEEQTEILDYLDNSLNEITEDILKEEKRTELLKEYKQSLLSEVVTGKKRVTEDMI